MIFNILMVASVVGLGACGSDAVSDDAVGSADKAKNLAETFVSGDAQSAEKEGPLYVVEVAMANGAKVTVELNAETGDLVEIEDKKGPFDYEIKPGMGFLTYSKARDLALEQAGEEVVAWNLRAASVAADSDSEDEESAAPGEDFRYEFYVGAGNDLWEVKLDAKDGKVQSVETKDAID